MNAVRIQKGSKTFIQVTFPDGSTKLVGGKRAARNNFVVIRCHRWATARVNGEWASVPRPSPLWVVEATRQDHAAALVVRNGFAEAHVLCVGIV